MSSWVQLLLALLAACLRFSIAEGDALPAALVELVRKSTISSTEDLQLLLLTDSIDEEDGTSAANGGHRLPRSLDAQPAQQALCKVRTEVVEVTRAMLDRSNANFLLWPPCVEVQRCSGCCNTKSLQCLPIVTHTRYLQVMKIEYINKRPTYAKAVVSFVDHVECRCQPTPHSPGPKTKSSRKQHIRLHRNETLSQDQAQGQVKVHSKDELHQWDELKQNQRAHLDDLLQQQWRPRGDTFSQPGEGDNNVHSYYTAAISCRSLQTPASLRPNKEKNEKESQTDQQGSNESNANVELKQTSNTNDDFLVTL
ncbi:platelet-derived growth factor subunit B isoform X3 [Amphiprion ocellaris]|uniref:platelet-derived growth factor subunit B isoform X3 n=1 Tax=Amphiprion ocellaris TaxID=80972 RepID=UPI0024111F7F|nr:platelet-derived growth factor subunit B isoform X3 [Amphiprion ocellaris]